jgi:hypothetical protein
MIEAGDDRSIAGSKINSSETCREAGVRLVVDRKPRRSPHGVPSEMVSATCRATTRHAASYRYLVTCICFSP